MIGPHGSSARFRDVRGPIVDLRSRHQRLARAAPSGVAASLTGRPSTQENVMSDEPVPNEPTQNIERGALTDIALIVASVGGAVQAIKTSVEAGAQVYDLLHPPKPEVPKLIVSSGTSKGRRS